MSSASDSGGTTGQPLEIEEESLTPAAEADRVARQRAHDVSQRTLELTRRSAEKWAGTTVAVFTALGLASLVEGRREIQRLGMDWSVADGAILLVAFLLALAAIVLAAMAAQGTPRSAAATGSELRQFELEDAAGARSRLRRSRLGTSMAIILVVAGLGVLWFAPARDSSYLVLLPDGSAATCIQDERPPPSVDGATVIKVDDCSTSAP